MAVNCSVLKPSELSKLKNTRVKDCSIDKKTDSSQNSPSGMMSLLSDSITPTVENISNGLFQSVIGSLCPAGSRARILASLEKALESMGKKARYFSSSRESLAKYDPDTSSWKTPRLSAELKKLTYGSSKWRLISLGTNGASERVVCDSKQTLHPFLGNFPKSGMMLSGTLYPLPKSELYTAAKDGGSGERKIPTPTTMDIYTANMKSTQQKENSMHSVTLSQLVEKCPEKMFPTPTKDAATERNKKYSQGGEPLTLAVKKCPEKMFPTPRANSGGEACEHGSGGLDLQTAVKYPTPAARDYKGANSVEHIETNGTGRKHMDQLANFVKHSSFPTPKTNGFCGGSGAAAKVRNNDELSIEEKRSMLAGNCGQLNPDWVEWLMDWLIGWSRAEPITAAWREINIDPADYPGDIPRITNEKKDRCNRIKAIGNGQVPSCKAIAMLTLAIALKGYRKGKTAGLKTSAPR